MGLFIYYEEEGACNDLDMGSYPQDTDALTYNNLGMGPFKQNTDKGDDEVNEPIVGYEP